MDARDFDDALSLREIEEGIWEVGVHIAGVAYYVTPQSALDKEAEKRGNSTYLVGEVVPMLPRKLSNGICSLVEQEDRLVKSVLFRFDENGNLLGSKLAECVICSDKRLTYEQAILFLQGNSIQKIKDSAPTPNQSSGTLAKIFPNFQTKTKSNQSIDSKIMVLCIQAQRKSNEIGCTEFRVIGNKNFGG